MEKAIDGKKVLVTGGWGFIGSEFVRMLSGDGTAEIVNVDWDTYAGDRRRLDGHDYRHVTADIADERLMRSVFEVHRPDYVVHFAAESHVDRSIEDSSAFVRTNVLGTQVLLECARSFGVERFLQVSCYDDKTRALTTSGLKEYDEIEEGDEVISINPSTGEIETKPVDKVIVQDYEGEMLCFSGQRVDLCVTPNHRMFILNRSRNLVVEEARKTAMRSRFYFPTGEWVGRDLPHTRVEGLGLVDSRDLMYLMGIFLGDGFTAYQERNVPNKSGLAKEDWLKEARGRGGKFEDVGMVGEHTESTCRSYRIFIDIPESDACRKRVEETLTRLGIAWHGYRGASGEHLYFTSKEWCRFFDRNCMRGAKNKRVPMWAKEYGPAYLRCLLEGLVDSDGSRKGDGSLRIFYSSSVFLVDAVCEIALKIGLKPQRRFRHMKSVIDGRVVEGDGYYVFLAKTTKSLTGSHVSTIDYCGKIWCLKVRDNANFVVERNGRFDYCGNTDEVYGDIGKGARPSREDDRLLPSSPYSASKAAADLLALSFVRTHGLDVVVTRCSNNYGPWQDPEKLIPLMTTRAIRGERLPVYGDGTNVRDWIHVNDHCRGIMAALLNGRAGRVYNFGGDSELDNLTVVRTILANLNLDAGLMEFVEDRKGHDFRYAIDFGRATDELGWTPAVLFGVGLYETVRWYQNNEWWWKR